MEKAKAKVKAPQGMLGGTVFKGNVEGTRTLVRKKTKLGARPQGGEPWCIREREGVCVCVFMWNGDSLWRIPAAPQPR